MTDQDNNVPAWQRKTAGESRITASLAVLAIVVLQVLSPNQFLPQPAWLVPTLEILLLGVLVVANPVKVNREERWLRFGGLVMTGLLSLATAMSAYRLVQGLIDGTLSDKPSVLLGSGGAVWLTNVVAFGLWYWEFDRGGPAARAHARKPLPDFLFVQMENPELAGPEWEPEFTDYLYLAFTNATAFSPTDVMPMSRWAKMMMMAQSMTSLILVVLVIARAINTLH